VTRRRRGEAGLTLVELMIAVVLSGIVVSAALAMGFSMMNAYRDHRAMVLVERSARVSLEMMADAVRGSSPGVKDGNIEDAVGCAGQVGLRFFNNVDDPDELEVVYPVGGIMATLAGTAYLPNSTSLNVLPGEHFDGTTIAAGDYIVVTDLSSGVIVEVTDVAPDSDQFTISTARPSGVCTGPSFPVTAWPGSGFAEGSLVIRAKIARFSIVDDASTGNVPMLMMDPDGDGPDEAQPMAQGIEDMQIAVAYDTNDDGQITENGLVGDDDEWFYNHPDDSDPVAGAQPRAVRITLVARSTREQSNVNTYVPPDVEDHLVGSPTPDPYRRRVLSTTIDIRNLRGSP